MNKSGAFGMQCHQISSFAAPLMRLSRCEAVFWPGCALMNLDPVILQKTAAVLRRAEPSLGLSSCCCGQPTRYLFPQQFPGGRRSCAPLSKKKASGASTPPAPTVPASCRVWARKYCPCGTLWPVSSVRRISPLPPHGRSPCMTPVPCGSRRRNWMPCGSCFPLRASLCGSPPITGSKRFAAAI